MVLWMCLALMTGAAVMAVLWPLSARTVRPVESGTDVLFYKDQLREIERDVERHLLGPAEAESARAEAGGRLLRAASADAARSEAATGEPALRRRRAASALALSVIPIVGLALYGALGSPNLVASGRPAVPASGDDLSAAIGQIETHLARNPEDGRGWSAIAPVYLRLGRPDDAARAFAEALRLAGETPERLEGYGESLVAAGGGVVSDTARKTFERALAREPASPRAAFFLALADEQDGDAAAARARYKALLDASPPNAPWLDAVSSRFAALGEPAPAAADMPAAAAAPAIAAMVSGLDERLARQGGSEAEWARLIRSYVVLGQPDQARDRLGRATAALAGDAGAAERLRTLFDGLGLASGGGSR